MSTKVCGVFFLFCVDLEILLRINTFYYHEYRCLKNAIHQIDSRNELLLLSASFTAKFGLAFVLALENDFLRARLHETRSELKPIWNLKPQLKSQSQISNLQRANDSFQFINVIKKRLSMIAFN